MYVHTRLRIILSCYVATYIYLPYRRLFSRGKIFTNWPYPKFLQILKSTKHLAITFSISVVTAFIIILHLLLCMVAICTVHTQCLFLLLSAINYLVKLLLTFYLVYVAHLAVPETRVSCCLLFSMIVMLDCSCIKSVTIVEWHYSYSYIIIVKPSSI